MSVTVSPKLELVESPRVQTLVVLPSGELDSAHAVLPRLLRSG